MQGIRFVDVLLLFLVGGVLGYIIESLYCLVQLGRIEGRKGVIYGPFNQVYGLGAVLLTLVLAPLVRRGWFALFLGGAVLGGVFESLCSLVQEKLYGTVSWEYSGERGSLFGGRTSLRYMLFWGVLASLYIRLLHPVLFGLFAKIPDSVKLPLVYGLVLLVAVDLLLSSLAVLRWQERQMPVPTPETHVTRCLDAHFPDGRMQRIYPNMVAVEKMDASERLAQES